MYTRRQSSTTCTRPDEKNRQDERSTVRSTLISVPKQLYIVRSSRPSPGCERSSIADVHQTCFWIERVVYHLVDVLPLQSQGCPQEERQSAGCSVRNNDQITQHFFGIVLDYQSAFTVLGSCECDMFDTLSSANVTSTTHETNPGTKSKKEYNCT